MGVQLAKKQTRTHRWFDEKATRPQALLREVVTASIVPPHTKDCTSQAPTCVLQLLENSFTKQLAPGNYSFQSELDMV
jgi:hypothetical protein